MAKIRDEILHVSGADPLPGAVSVRRLSGCGWVGADRAVPRAPKGLVRTALRGRAPGPGLEDRRHPPQAHPSGGPRTAPRPSADATDPGPHLPLRGLRPGREASLTDPGCASSLPGV